MLVATPGIVKLLLPPRQSRGVSYATLERLLREQEQRRDGDFVFHHDGRCIKNYNKAWKKAVLALDATEGFEGAGYGKQFDPETGKMLPVLKRWHDLRHTAAQQLSDAGVPSDVILDVGGWKTAAMLERYRIVSDARKRAALQRRDDYVAEERERVESVLAFPARAADGPRSVGGSRSAEAERRDVAAR